MKRIFTIILMVQSLLLVPIAHAQTYWNGTADKEFSGMGTEAAPYLITTAEELAGLAARVNDDKEDFAHFRGLNIKRKQRQIHPAFVAGVALHAEDVQAADKQHTENKQQFPSFRNDIHVH